MMLIFTNRLLNTAATNESALSRTYVPFADTLNSVNVQATSGSAWKISGQQSKLSDAAARDKLTAVLSGDKPVLVYLHGNNNSPATCFARCQQLEEQYEVAVIGYSCTS